jgi:hypothetical protein
MGPFNLSHISPTVNILPTAATGRFWQSVLPGASIASASAAPLCTTSGISEDHEMLLPHSPVTPQPTLSVIDDSNTDCNSDASRSYRTKPPPRVYGNAPGFPSSWSTSAAPFPPGLSVFPQPQSFSQPDAQPLRPLPSTASHVLRTLTSCHPSLDQQPPPYSSPGDSSRPRLVETSGPRAMSPRFSAGTHARLGDDEVAPPPRSNRELSTGKKAAQNRKAQCAFRERQQESVLLLYSTPSSWFGIWIF